MNTKKIVAALSALSLVAIVGMGSVAIAQPPPNPVDTREEAIAALDHAQADIDAARGYLESQGTTTPPTTTIVPSTVPPTGSTVPPTSTSIPSTTTTTIPPTTTQPPVPGVQGLITRVGNQLRLNGEQYKFAGLNADTWFGCWDGESGRTNEANLDRYFRELNPHSMTRVWAYGNTDWQATLQRIVTKAEQYDQYLMVTLSDGNNNGAQCGSNKGPNYPSDGGAVATHATAIATAFSATPAIAVWEIINEGNRNASNKPFYQAVAQRIRAADPNTLIATGAGTCYDTTWQNCVAVQDFPENDLISMHEYDWNNGGVSHWADETAQVARVLNRPWFNGEDGFCCNGGPSGLTETNAATYLSQEYTSYLTTVPCTGCQTSSGMLYWDLKWAYNSASTINLGDPAWNAASAYRHEWQTP